MYRVVVVLLLLAPAAAYAQGPQVIEGMYPTQLVRGQSNVLHIGINGRQDVAAVEIVPAAGMTVKSIARSDVRQNQGWWDVTVEVAPDAMPGNRTIMATGPMLRTAVRPLTVPTQVPTIADVKILSAQVNQPAVQFSFAMKETPDTIGASPSVWYFLDCGDEPVSGVAKASHANGVVTASIPNPRTQLKPFAPPPKSRCDLEFRASDSKMADSNVLKTTVDFK